jgi:hypothetical protein
LNDDLQFWVTGKQTLLPSLADGGELHVLFLSQGFGEIGPLAVRVSRFEPLPGDRTAYHWNDSSGQHRSMKMPPYFISDLEAARDSIRQFLFYARAAYIEALLADSNSIVRETFQVALDFIAFGQVSGRIYIRW